MMYDGRFDPLGFLVDLEERVMTYGTALYRLPRPMSEVICHRAALALAYLDDFLVIGTTVIQHIEEFEGGIPLAESGQVVQLLQEETGLSGTYHLQGNFATRRKW